MAVDLVVCCSTEMEASLVQAHLPVLITGVGAVNAACALTRFLEQDGARGVIACGIAGAYPASASGLQIGEVAWAVSESYGDLGAGSADGFLDMRALGFPVIGGAEPTYNELPMTLRGRGRFVPFVTVNTCTGSDAVAAEMVRRTGGAVESMEGAAIAHVARLYGIPAGEVRGISNMAGNRDRGSWRVREAAVAAQEELLRAWRAGELGS